MAQRYFRDSTGAEWRAFDVRPNASDRRRGSDRRTAVAADPIVERRRTPERRVRVSGAYDTGSRHAYQPGFEKGWLCFECGALRRRLAPIPADWESCSHQELAGHLERATHATTSRIA
jgi:hypothetical protein